MSATPAASQKISYKTKLAEYLKQRDISPPKYVTTDMYMGWESYIHIDGHTYTHKQLAGKKIDVEERVAEQALTSLLLNDTRYVNQSILKYLRRSGESGDSFFSEGKIKRVRTDSVLLIVDLDLFSCFREFLDKTVCDIRIDVKTIGLDEVEDLKSIVVPSREMWSSYLAVDVVKDIARGISNHNPIRVLILSDKAEVDGLITLLKRYYETTKVIKCTSVSEIHKNF